MNFDSITRRFPEEHESLARLEAFLNEHGQSGSEFTFEQLCDAAKPEKREHLAIVLGEAAREGLLRQIIRVISPATHAGIGDFESLNDVPDCIRDAGSGDEIEIGPKDLLVIYTVRRGCN